MRVNHDCFEVVICLEESLDTRYCALVLFFCKYSRSRNYEACKNLIHRNYANHRIYLSKQTVPAAYSNNGQCYHYTFTHILSLSHACQFRTVPASSDSTHREGCARSCLSVAVKSFLCCKYTYFREQRLR